MQRHVGAEVLDQPAAEAVDLVARVVLSGNEQGRDLEPHLGLPGEPLEGVENRLEVGEADAVVEGLGERLQVDVRRVHVGEQVPAGGRRHVAARHGDAPHAPRAGRLRAVDGVLGEDDGVVVGEGDAGAAGPGRGLGNPGRRRGGRQRVVLPRLRDVPVLAEPAAEVAAGGAERQHARPRVEVAQRLLLDGVDAEAAGPAVAGEHDLAAPRLPHVAEGLLPVVEPAETGTQVALHAAVVEAVPPRAAHHPRLDLVAVDAAAVRVLHATLALSTRDAERRAGRPRLPFPRASPCSSRSGRRERGRSRPDCGPSKSKRQLYLRRSLAAGPGRPRA